MLVARGAARRAALLSALAVAPLALGGQRPVAPAAAVDTVAADSVADGRIVSEDSRPARTTAGISIGALQYRGGRTEQATSATLRWRILPWLSVGATPTLGRAREPIAAAPGGQTVVGLTDLPVELSAEHPFDALLSPTLGASLDVTLPVGDSTRGFGAGRLGTSLTLSAAVAPWEWLGLRAGIGRSLSDFGLQSSFVGSASTFGDASASLQATDRLSLNAGLDGDVTHPDPSTRRALSVTGGMSVSAPAIGALALSASRGITGTTPKWSIAVGIGTEFAAVGRTTLNSTSARLRRAFGGGKHGVAAH